MTFYNTKIIAAEKFPNGLRIFRKIKNDIYMEYFKRGTDRVHKEALITNIIADFDIDYSIDGEINILYVNKNKNLILYEIDDDRITEKEIIHCKNRIIEPMLVISNELKNIFFIEDSNENDNSYIIKHIIIENDKIDVEIVDEIKTYKILNPIKVIKNNRYLLIAYYFLNQICVKVFDYKTKSWSPSTTLTNNQNKLYLDLLKIDNRLHLVYADFTNELFSIKYERFLFKEEHIIKETEIDISKYGNHTDPILIFYNNILWICWKDTNQLLSVFSNDNGNNWSEVLEWKESKVTDMVKYKYLTNIVDKNIIHNSYGSIYPEIKFMGFKEVSIED